MKKYIFKLDVYEFGEFYESQVVDVDIYDKEEAVRELVFMNGYVKNEFDEFILKDKDLVVVATIHEINI